MSESLYRKSAREIIARVLELHGDKSDAELRLLLREAYPFGERRFWPYRIWCEQVRLQLAAHRAIAEMNRRFGRTDHAV